MSDSVRDDIPLRTTHDLRSMLLDTIKGVRHGDVDYDQGKAIAALADAALRSAKLDFDVFRYCHGNQEHGQLMAIELQSDREAGPVGDSSIELRAMMLRLLKSNGPQSLNKLAEKLDVKREMVEYLVSDDKEVYELSGSIVRLRSQKALED